MSHLAWYFFANAYASLGKFGHLRVRSLVWEARAFVLVPRNSNKILRTHPPQVSSTKENLPRHTRRTLAQLRPNKSAFLLPYLHKIDVSTHPPPLCRLVLI